MWDVVWTDPKRESRKEHRERKARQPRSDKSSTKARSLFSRGSTSSSDGPSFVGYPGRKTSSRDFAPLSPTPSSIHTTTSTNNYDIEADRSSNFTLNNYETTSDTVSHSFESTTDHTLVHEQILECSSELYNTNSRGDDDQYPLPPSPPWDTQVIERVALEPCHIVQTFSEGSYIARSTEVTTSLRTPSDPQFGLSSEVTITANTESKSFSRPRSSGGHTPRRVPSCNALLRSEPTDGWKPPDTWACTPTTETFSSTMEDPVEEPSSQESTFPMEQNAMQREVTRLASESNSIRLLRLKGVWGTLSSPNSWKDLEVEKTQWMLSALYNMDQQADEEDRPDTAQDMNSDKPKKVLALYETPAATSYLAAVHHSKQVYHLSPAPLSHTLFPNIHPVLVPVRSSSAFPMAPSSFEAVYSLRLPLSTPSQEIPGVLKNIHRCLKPNGALNLVLVDPLPLASTLGPLLRAWIEHNLLLNLETNFRCMNPSRLLPIWLENASLHIEGRITSTQFSAVPLDEQQLTPAENSHPSEDTIKQELRNIVGRMLWMEVWGEYITVDTWWWEDLEIIEECVRLQTTWEWRLITACKDG
ncbi:uncharacterized protein NECHADRAFT_97614 [Fusarium vanettenii 77-13-4]|uniref:Uncharacterized protein n=1 Tax=Fusarium vanettenii (strain ATCC MYA-4622 / CBS 123669 / FGSC 9596 / NRRL 45880 / 77-13-4) TaxID=660122 RepID=C7ZE35_FUSV7|nr:uncharacterized protein NECHADRAFT_97614 [Fusarium vanettenii 77-13-4]EEU37637.1 hypothetical protein NECHADRAFT_97614 [Fusarium vanettenii 77-13-4]